MPPAAHELKLRKARAGDNPRELYDRNGLYLVVKPVGGNLWRGKYRVNGREKTLGLGPYAKICLAGAPAAREAGGQSQANG